MGCFSNHSSSMCWKACGSANTLGSLVGVYVVQASRVVYIDMNECVCIFHCEHRILAFAVYFILKSYRTLYKYIKYK